jgi:hypothetical protein
MEEEQKQHLSVVNASGFPLQLAVAASVRASRTSWRQLLSEHPWRHPETGKDGYIDLILQRGTSSSDIMVVECKRQRGDARWYFLDTQPDSYDSRIVITRHDPRVVDVQEFAFFPTTPAARFCVLHGEDSPRRSLLERLADDLLQSVEAFAMEQLTIDPVPLFRYLPVVVTNARLFLCSADPTSISLKTGELPSTAEFSEIPFVRFRKTLWASRLTEAKDPQHIMHVHSDRERTILVVSAPHLELFLQKAQFRQ